MILKPRISGGVAYKRRWEFFAAILGISLGYLLLLVTMLIPGYNQELMYQAIPSLFRGLFLSISDTTQNNPYYPLTIFFISYIDFPSCLAWILPGFLIGYYRNKQFYNLEIKNNGWKAFWHGIYFLEAVFIILSLGLILFFSIQFIPGFTANENMISFFGSGILKVMLFFITPFFWLGLLFAGIGGYLGSKLALKRAAKSEVVIEELDTEDIFEEEQALIKEMDDNAFKEPQWPEEFSKEPLEDIKEVNIKRLKAKIKESDPEITSQDMVKCPNCGNNLPTGAKFCNNCGKKLI